MVCSQIPPAESWDDVSAELLEDYRNHIRRCNHCYGEILRSAPERLLFIVPPENLPDGFWIGFWDSLRKKMDFPIPVSPYLRPVRWVAAAVFCALVALSGNNLPDPGPVAVQSVLPQTEKEYPVLEDVKNTRVTYYVLQPAETPRIVFIFSPDIDL